MRKGGHEMGQGQYSGVSRCLMDSPLGVLCLTQSQRGITGIRLACEGDVVPPGKPGCWLELAQEQLQAYFRKELRRFDLPLDLQGTEFQKAVWRELREIPWGQTRSYGQIAARVNRPGAARAVGMACNRNPVLILIPCHRVVGRDGALTGFAAGLERKEFLLRLEQETGR